VHELAHAGIAWRAGARARRMGVMVMYGMPSMFCDVSDCWRLPRRRDRVKVAGAGIAAQAILAGGGFAATLVPGLGAGAIDGLLLYGMAGALVAAFNLVPFVRLDGYLMLMSALDVPNLRAKAIAQARETLARRVLRAPRRPPELPHGALVSGYGVACAVCPLVLSVYGLTRVHALLVPFGALGALIWLGGLGLLAVELVRRWGRALRSGGLRVALVCGVLAALVPAIASAIVVPRAIDGSFVVARGRVRLLLAPGSRGVEPGDRVVLHEPGLLVSRTIGRAVVADGPRGLIAGVVAPSAIEGLGEPSGALTAVVMRVTGNPIDAAAGTAVVTSGTESLLTRVTTMYLTSGLALL
jgi:putative peptide zinc metalloprotease protein